MVIAIFLAILGLLLLYVEFFIPGAVMGICGALLLLASIFLAVSQKISLFLLMGYVFGVIVSVMLIIKLALIKVKSTKDIYLLGDQEGYMASSVEEGLIGQRAKAASDLKPSGHIFVNNKYHQAVSKNRYIVKGEDVEIIEGKGSYLVVKSLKKKGGV